jgi:hypothetical protein
MASEGEEGERERERALIDDVTHDVTSDLMTSLDMRKEQSCDRVKPVDDAGPSRCVQSLPSV